MKNLAFNPVMLQTIPYSTLGGGLVFLLPQQRVSVSFVAMDPSGTAEKFRDAFDDGQAYAMETRIKTEFFGLPRHQLLGATGNTKEFTALNQDPRLFLAQIVAPGLFPIRQQGGSWSVYYNFDQCVYTEPGPPKTWASACSAVWASPNLIGAVFQGGSGPVIDLATENGAQ